MEINRPGRPVPGLAVAADMLNHRGDIGFKVRNGLGYFFKPPLKGIQAGPQHSPVHCHIAVNSRRLRTALEHRIKPARLPAESHRQRFQRPGTAAPLDRVQLNFPDHSRRHARTLRKLPLTPAKLADPATDGPADCSPVSRHAFRHACSSAFRFQRRD